jgi:hypothetical protein
MIAEMRPLLRPGGYVFTTASDSRPDLRPIMTFIEDEGPTLIVERSRADAAGLPYDLVLAWITLRVHSALTGVGLTAAVSTALADAGIACNMVAALHHDHVFVPQADAEAALTALTALSAAAIVGRD